MYNTTNNIEWILIEKSDICRKKVDPICEIIKGGVANVGILLGYQWDQLPLSFMGHLKKGTT